MKSTLIFILALALISCDSVQEIVIQNQSNDTIFFELSHNYKLEIFPIQKESNGDTLWTQMNVVFPNENVKLPLIGTNGWRNFINKKCIDSTLTIFFFDKELLETVSKDSLLTDQLYTQKLAYTVRDLEKLNWLIKYVE